jgi:hypothetical protein
MLWPDVLNRSGVMADWEGLICRWCNEGEYVLRASDNAHLTADASADVLECNVCAEPPMTFEHSERLRAREVSLRKLQRLGQEYEAASEGNK